MGCSKLGYLKKLLVLIGGLIAYGTINSAPALASLDVACPPNMTALFDQGSDDRCSFGMGNAIVGPYNDSRVNLMLLMTRPTPNQIINNENIWYWDAKSNPIQVPFYIEAVSDSATLVNEAETNKHYHRFVELIHGLGLDEKAQNEALARINADYKAPALSELALRALALQTVLTADTALSKQDRSAILKTLLRINLRARDTENGLSGSAKGYIAYINGADFFYSDDYDSAKQLFETLTQAKTTWVKEAATYNLIRGEIRKTQSDARDSYGFFDIAAIDQSESGGILPAIQRYLTAYPNGQYADSARHLKRRAYWFNHDHKALLAAYSDAIDEVRASNQIVEAAVLAEEIDDKFLFAYIGSQDTTPDQPQKLPAPLAQIEWNTPVIATSQILVRLRKPDSNNSNAIYEPVAIDAIKAHENAFKQKNALSLYNYLLIAYDFFKEEKYEAILQATQNWRDNLVNADYAGFSTAALRAHALEKLKRWDEAAILWKELHEMAPSPLLKDQFELAHAQNLENSGKLKSMFEPNSLIKSLPLRKRILRGSANAELLQYALDQDHISREEKAVALAALLNKSLMSKQYKSLLEHQKKYAALKLDSIDGLDLLRTDEINSDDGFKCPKWSVVLEDLSKQQAAPHSLLCLGERLRTLEDNGIAPHRFSKTELGGTDDNFGAKDLARLSLYLPVIGNPAAKGDDEAFALRRAMYCFATAGYNHCGSEEIPRNQRNAWFTKLKSTYKNSQWAAKQKYYW